MLPLITIVAALFAAPTGPGPGERSQPNAGRPPERDGGSTYIETIVLDVEGIDAAAFRDAAMLRLPGRQLAWSGAGVRAQVRFFAYLQLRPARDGGIALALILSDGRYYHRTIAGGQQLAPRAVASDLANLVAGIEEGRFEPDAEGVPLPDTVPQPTPPSASQPPARPKQRIRRPEVGLLLAPGVLIGLPPTLPAAFGGGGGGVEVGVRWPQGPYAALALRAIGQRTSNVGLARFRVAGIGGYVWRRDALELVVSAGFGAEPLVVLRNGGSQPLSRARGRDREVELLLGGHLRVAPAYRIVWPDGPVAGLRLGPVVELGASALAGRGGGIGRIASDDSETSEVLFRAGGLELWAGLDLGVWWRI